MIFVTYWELNTDFDPSELAEIAQKILSKGLWPSPGIKTLAWYITPEYWGITVAEAESEEALMKDANLWRIAKPGIFKVLKSSPAMKTEEVLPLMVQLKKKLTG